MILLLLQVKEKMIYITQYKLEVSYFLPLFLSNSVFNEKIWIDFVDLNSKNSCDFVFVRKRMKSVFFLFENIKSYVFIG